MKQDKNELVELVTINSSIRLDIRYATTNNFTGKIVYPSARCYLRTEVAHALAAVAKELEPLGLGIKVFDGYRPLEVQKKFWDLLSERWPDETERALYVANPNAAPRHCRGTAVDLTLIHLGTGAELEMPSDYDEFSEQALRQYPSMHSDEIRKNCKMLELIMEKHNFEPQPTEWWHFDYHGWQQYAVLDVTFDELL
ncbi:MAG: putative peptidase [candidate division TM6 bacterium GW2011_GWE2_41_16]|nr:MAG: putative peptidase [candidate division TM6 bacterium GW2011_GWE2_41_16]